MIKLKSICITIVLFILLLQISYAYTVSGNLYLDSEDFPITNAKVVLYEEGGIVPLKSYTTTNNEGYYEFNNVESNKKLYLEVHMKYSDSTHPKEVAFRVKEGTFVNLVEVLIDILNAYSPDKLQWALNSINEFVEANNNDWQLIILDTKKYSCPDSGCITETFNTVTDIKTTKPLVIYYAIQKAYNFLKNYKDNDLTWTKMALQMMIGISR
jgi:hypothetical protein